MRVDELIRQLSEFPGELDVLVKPGSHYYAPVTWTARIGRLGPLGIALGLGEWDEEEFVLDRVRVEYVNE
jgi:hypothetical protein